MHYLKNCRTLLFLAMAIATVNLDRFAQAQDAPTRPINAPEAVSLIPMNKRTALSKMLNAINLLGLNDVLDAKTLRENLGSGDDGYGFSRDEPRLIFTIDGLTGEIVMMRHVFKEPGADGDDGTGTLASVVQNVRPPNPTMWLQYLSNHGIDMSLLNFSWYSETNKFTTLSLRQPSNFVNERGQSLKSYFDVSKLDNEIYLANIENIIEWQNTTPTITFDQAMELANWLVEANNHTVLRAPSQFNEKQKQFWDPMVPRMAGYTAYHFYDPPRLEIRRDKWLMFRPEWNLEFGNFSILLDAETGRPVRNSYQSFIASVNDPSSIYHVDEIVSHQKPDWYVPSPVEQFPKLIFNNEDVEIERGTLHFPPLVREENPLIFADYFPKFLIDTKREGSVVTLSGQLPNKGKEAVLTIGSKEAIVDGKPLTLSGAPQEIDGRLYLPYELLHQCNGVLVRWDAKKNTLWVDTRYLRRP